MKDSNSNEKYFFEINKDQYNLFYFKLKDKNGNIYLKRGLYKHKTSCQEVIKSVIKNSKNREHFIIKQDYNDSWIVFMEDGNGIIIAYSQYFDTEEEAKNFIKNFKNLSLKTPVIDNTKIMIHSANKEKLYFEINKDQYNLFYFNLKDKNGNICLKRSFYKHKTSCQEGIESVINNSNNEERFEATQTNYGWIVYLKAENGEKIAISDYLDTEEEAKYLIKNLKNLSLKTPVIDKTK